MISHIDRMQTEQAKKTINKAVVAGVGLLVIGHQLVYRQPERLTDQLRAEIENNLDAVVVELLIAKADQAIHDLGVTSEDLSYYFNSEWAEHHDDPGKLRDMARAVLLLKSNDEHFDTEH